MSSGCENGRWRDTWQLYKEHGPALLRIATAICHQDTRLASDEAEDLVHSFVVDRLPRVAEASRLLPVDERHRYIRASFRNFLRSAARGQGRHVAALKQLEQELIHTSQESADQVKPDDTSLLADVRAAIHDLPPDLVQPAALYLGIGGPRQSIREIARKLKRTRYLTRLAVLNGLIAIAARLRARDLLSDREMEAARLVLLEGQGLEHAARSLGLTRQQVHSALERARQALAARFQTRTKESGDE